MHIPSDDEILHDGRILDTKLMTTLDNDNDVSRDRQSHWRSMKNSFDKKLQRGRNDYEENIGCPDDNDSEEFVAECNGLQNFCSNECYFVCSRCELVSLMNMQPGYAHGTAPVQHCTHCAPDGSSQYRVPRSNDFDLPDFSFHTFPASIQSILSPCIFRPGPYKKMNNGYRAKTSAMRISLKPLHTNPSLITDELDCSHHSPRIIQLAKGFYQALLTDTHRSFYQSIHQLASSRRKRDLTLREACSLPGLECALWPLWYQNDSLSDTVPSPGEEGNQRYSAKRSFLVKVMSKFANFSSSFDLLQFHFDRYLYKTVSGAIETARQQHVSPNAALENKQFHCTYWANLLNALLDATDPERLGHPDMFVTMSPYEWTWPYPQFYLDRLDALQVGPTYLGMMETILISHVMDNVLKRMVSGMGEKSRWAKKALFRDGSSREADLVTHSMFYRFEFQNRFSIHSHALFWLNTDRCSYILDTNTVRGDRPLTNANDYALVTAVQTADQVNSMPCTSASSHVTDDRIVLRHPQYDCHLRAFILPLVRVLRCSMDVQTCDANKLLMKYVTSYAAKLHSDVGLDCLTPDFTGLDAAYKVLWTTRVGVPEMTLILTDQKSAYWSDLHKTFKVPPFERLFGNKTILAYAARSANMENHSLIAWLRVNTNANGTWHPYKRHGTMSYVGMYLGSPLGHEFLLRHSIAYVAFRLPAVDDRVDAPVPTIFPPSFHDIPERLQPVAVAMHCNSQLWDDDAAIHQHMNILGHKSSFIDSFIQRLRADIDLLVAHLEGISINLAPYLVRSELTDAAPPTGELNAEQLAAFARYVACFQRHPALNDDEDHDLLPHHDDPANRVRFPLIVGGPGTGKSYIIKHILHHFITNTTWQRAAVITPTGVLSFDFQSQFGGARVDCDTLHGFFTLPVSDETGLETNWSLTGHMLIIVDEVSQLNERMMACLLQHGRELPQRPILVMLGDDDQQPPINQIGSSLDLAAVRRIFHTYVLTINNRTTDERLIHFLAGIRRSIPQYQWLQEMIGHKYALERTKSVTSTDERNAVLKYFQRMEDITFLCERNHDVDTVNQTIVHHLFQRNQRTPVWTGIGYDKETTVSFYRGQKVIVTETRDKSYGYINGVIGHLRTKVGSSLIVEITIKGEARSVPVFPVHERNRLYYPIRPAYAMTIFKCQGRTLGNICVWFGPQRKSMRASGYVACSRPRHFHQLFFLYKPTIHNFIPAHSMSGTGL